MAHSSLKPEVRQNGEAPPRQLDRESSIESLGKLWFELERRLAASTDEDEAQCSADSIIDTQSVIIGLCALAPAASIREALWKLAVWRCDTPDLPPGPSTPRNDVIAYCAFRDLVRLTSNEDLLVLSEAEKS